MFNPQNAEQQIADMYDSVLANPLYRDEVLTLQDQFGQTRDSVINTWYNFDVTFEEDGFSNESYGQHSIRLVMHMHNLVEGNWHDERQQVIQKYLRDGKSSTICELGFGTPQRYVRAVLGNSAISQVLLCEYKPEDLEFAAAVLDIWDPQWGKKIKLLQHDMATDELPPSYDTYIFQDSAEHVPDPTTRHALYIDSMKEGAEILYSLPVEPSRPFSLHTISWKDEAEVLQWVTECGARPRHVQTIDFNRELDLHVAGLDPHARQLAVRAVKPAPSPNL